MARSLLHVALVMSLVAMFVIRMTMPMTVVSMARRRGLVMRAAPRPAAVLVRVEAAAGAGAAVPPLVLLVPVRQGLATERELVVLDRDDLHPLCLSLCRCVVVVVAVLVGRGGGGGVGARPR